MQSTVDCLPLYIYVELYFTGETVIPLYLTVGGQL